ncbi:hypothetical protein Tco_0085933 [Tanacetum coccineum]
MYTMSDLGCAGSETSFTGKVEQFIAFIHVELQCHELRKTSIKHEGADDEEVSEGDIPWVIVYGYDRLPIQPVSPPSPDYIPGQEDPQTPPVPQDKDEREPMFVQAYDPDYLLPPVDSPTAESPGYVSESNPEEDSKEYEDDETGDGPVDYPMDEGDKRTLQETVWMVEEEAGVKF